MTDPRCGQAGYGEGEADTVEGSGAAGSDPGDGAFEGENGPGWREAGEELNDLRDTFRSSYQEGAAEGPSREEVINAFRTLGDAITNIASGAGNTLKDPQVKQQVKKTTSSAVSAISGILLEWSADLRTRLREKQEREAREAGDPDHAGPVSSETAAESSDGEVGGADTSA
ncbi:MAG: hypothetical protein OXN93_10635 [bacterium]|nr:hypothetical protein [bacterium]